MATPSNDYSYNSDDDRFAGYEPDGWDEEAYQREYEETHPSEPNDAHHYQATGPNDDNNTGPPDYGPGRRSGLVRTSSGTQRVDHASHGFVQTPPESEHRDQHYARDPRLQSDHQPTPSGSREPHRPTLKRVPVPTHDAHIGYRDSEDCTPRDIDQPPFLPEAYGRYEGSYKTTYVPVGPPIFVNSPPIPFDPPPTHSGGYFSPPVGNVVGHAAFTPPQLQVSPTDYMDLYPG